MDMEQHKPSKNPFLYGGALVAALIGSGFASGQEIMQFFAVYGTAGILAGCGLAFVAMFLFAWAVLAGSRDLGDGDVNDAFCYLCGKGLGRVLGWLLPIFLYMIFIVMLSGAGSLLTESFGLHPLVGRLAIALLSLCAVLLGMGKLVSILGRIGPVVICFILVIGVVSLLQNAQQLPQADQLLHTLPLAKATPWWWLSGITYAAFCSLAMFPFLAGMGKNMQGKLPWQSAGIGCLFFTASAAVVSLAILASLQDVYARGIPTVFLAEQIYSKLGLVFTLVMFLGIFTSAAPMLWTACHRLCKDEKSPRFRLVAVALVAFACLGGMLPFGKLVNLLYPYMGYLSLIPFFAVLLRRAAKKAGLSKPRSGARTGASSGASC